MVQCANGPGRSLPIKNIHRAPSRVMWCAGRATAATALSPVSRRPNQSAPPCAQAARPSRLPPSLRPDPLIRGSKNPVIHSAFSAFPDNFCAFCAFSRQLNFCLLFTLLRSRIWRGSRFKIFPLFRFPAFPPFAFNHGNSFVSSLCCSKKVFGLRPSDFFRASDFGLRILSVSICVWCRSSALWLKNIRVNWRTFADHPCSVVRPCLGPAIRSVVGNPRFRFLGEPLRPPRLCVCRWPDHLLNWCQFAQFA